MRRLEEAGVVVLFMARVMRHDDFTANGVHISYMIGRSIGAVTHQSH
jgi:hypothetical protein